MNYAGERFDFIVETNQPVNNYWMRFRGLMDCDERFLSAYQVAILRYEGAPDAEPEVEVSYDRVRNNSYGLVRIPKLRYTVVLNTRDVDALSVPREKVFRSF